MGVVSVSVALSQAYCGRYVDVHNDLSTHQTLGAKYYYSRHEQNISGSCAPCESHQTCPLFYRYVLKSVNIADDYSTNGRSKQTHITLLKLQPKCQDSNHSDNYMT